MNNLYWGLVYTITFLSGFCLGYGKGGDEKKHDVIFVVGVVLGVVLTGAVLLGAIMVVNQ